MSRKTVIKQFLNEVAGISFEVRKWAQTIEDYVKNYVAAEREKLKSQTPQTPPTQTPPTQKPPTSFSWSAPSEEVESGFTHFEDDNYQEYQTANIYADELFINSDILEDFPGIKSAVTGKLFSVTFDDEGRFFVDAVGSSFPEKFREAIDEMIEDHMVMGEAFYTDDYELVYASSYDDDYGSRYDYYMNENNRDSYDDDYAEWRRNRGNDYGYSGGYSYSYTPQPKIDKIEIDGNDFPEAYKNFNVDKWIITPSNRIEYDHWKSGYNEAGQYVVYLNMPLSSVGGSALIHEIKHAYDDWNRMRKGAPPIRAGWEIQNIYTPDFEKLVLGGSFKISPMLHPIIRYYYLGSKLEAPAYLENEYDSPVMGSYRDTAKKLMNFKASNFLDKRGNPAKGLQESWSMLIAEYDIPFFRKFKNVVDFLKYTEKYFNKRGRDILRRIDKMKYVHGKPMTTQAPPKVYTSAPVKPTTTTQPTQPTQVSTGLPKPKTNLNQVEIDKLDKQIDRLEDEWDKLNLDPEKNKMDLDEIDLIIRELLNKRNRLVRDGEVDQDLPF